jgi:cytochrome c-type biogenesis protein CcmH
MNHVSGLTTRRDFLASFAGAGSAIVVAAVKVSAQQRTPIMHDSSVVKEQRNLFDMDQSAARAVTLPPKPNALPIVTDDERDALEHRIHCQCGCTLDIYTCRTTDFSCQVSPAMHRDVVELVRGGYSAQEIMDAFHDVYGERVLMSPTKSGFNLLAWFAPGTAVVIAAGVLVVLLRRWMTTSRMTVKDTPANTAAFAASVDATPDELARLDAAVKGERDA